MNNKLVITKHNNKIISAFMEDGDMIQVSINSAEETGILGNIYLGKVKNIVKNINAAFIEIANGQMCYYSIAENPYPILAKGQGYDKENADLQETKLKIGDELIVQVAKEDVKSKAPVVSSNLNFTGKYVALTYGKRTVGVSSKITDNKERQRLRKLVTPYVSKEFGLIIRTNAAYIEDKKLIDEILALQAAYEDIRKYGVHKTCFSLLYSTPPGYICDIRDGYADNVDEVVTDDKELYENIKNYLKQYQKEDLSKLRLYTDDLISLSNLYGIRSKISEAIRPMVWLKSGGSIIIQPTEALTVIDVNTGKAVAGKKKVQETFLKVNLEAAKEIARQIRLRNLSGIIIIDFIDMVSVADKKLLMEELDKHLKKDPIKTVLVDMTALGLVEVTRKKVRKPLYEMVKEGELKN